jgi:hypothetical protein
MLQRFKENGNGQMVRKLEAAPVGKNNLADVQ